MQEFARFIFWNYSHTSVCVIQERVKTVLFESRSIDQGDCVDEWYAFSLAILLCYFMDYYILGGR
jgi:hypothetical protein